MQAEGLKLTKTCSPPPYLINQEVTHFFNSHLDNPVQDRILPSRSIEVFEDADLKEEGWTNENIRRLVNQNPREFQALNPVEKNLKIGAGAKFFKPGSNLKLIGAEASPRVESQMTLTEYRQRF